MSTCRRAFTLIELLVVVAIIALLIAILLPALAGARNQARRAAGAANFHGIGSAYSMYTNEWEQVTPLSVRGWNKVYNRNDPMSRAYTDTVHQIAYWTYTQNEASDGIANQLRFCMGGDSLGPVSKLWVSPGSNVQNPFATTYPWPTTSVQLGVWPYYCSYEILGNGLSKLQSNGSTKILVTLAYQIYAGDPGNTCAAMGQTYFDQSNNPWPGMDNYKTRLKDMRTDDLLMQDLAVKDSANFYRCNYIVRNGTLKDSYLNTQQAEFGPASGGMQNYNAGYYITDKESDIAGINVLYADGSASWMPINRTTKVNFKATSGATWKLYIGIR